MKKINDFEEVKCLTSAVKKLKKNLKQMREHLIWAKENHIKGTSVVFDKDIFPYFNMDWLEFAVEDIMKDTGIKVKFYRFGCDHFEVELDWFAMDDGIKDVIQPVIDEINAFLKSFDAETAEWEWDADDDCYITKKVFDFSELGADVDVYCKDNRTITIWDDYDLRQYMFSKYFLLDKFNDDVDEMTLLNNDEDKVVFVSTEIDDWSNVILTIGKKDI